jgi:polysaccharide export outer membrane protein
MRTKPFHERFRRKGGYGKILGFMKILPLLFLSLSFLMAGCYRAPCCLAVEGATEFVLDSYILRQGKNAILQMQGIELEELPCDALLEYQDEIVDDDILNIAIWHPTRKDLIRSIQFINDKIGFKVSNGYVTIPDIPPLLVAGLTLEEAKKEIQNAFQNEIQDVEVFVTYKDRLSRKVDLIGHVQFSTLPVDGKIRLYEILSKAHVPLHANFFSSYVLRNGKMLPIDLHRLIQEGDMSQNIVMRGGDKVYIADPTDAKVIVMGEVLSPRPVNLPYGTMSIREAIVQAGGIPYTGNRNCIQVIRGSLVCPKIYLLHWEEIVQLPNDSLLLMPGDTVYVSETPITQWNRFISQLLPSISGVQISTDMLRTLNAF